MSGEIQVAFEPYKAYVAVLLLDFVGSRESTIHCSCKEVILPMPRQSSRTSSSAPQRAAPAPSHGRAAPAPAAAPAQQAPPPAAAPAAAPPAVAPSSGGMFSGLMGSMMSGVATGTGMAVANRAVDAVMGPRQTEVVHRHEGAPAPAASSQPACQFQQDQLTQCMKSSSDASSCQSFMDALKACQQGQ